MASYCLSRALTLMQTAPWRQSLESPEILPQKLNLPFFCLLAWLGASGIFPCLLNGKVVSLASASRIL